MQAGVYSNRGACSPVLEESNKQAGTQKLKATSNPVEGGEQNIFKSPIKSLAYQIVSYYHLGGKRQISYITMVYFSVPFFSLQKVWLQTKSINLEMT